MFGLFSNKSESLDKICNPIKGKCIALEEVEDEVFSAGMMGKGVAVIPYEGKVFSPFDGEITMTFPTGHAIGMVSASGVELLIHVGIDTVKMNGAGFNLKVVPEQKVKCGDLLMEFDINAIKNAGHPITSPIIITNSDEYAEITPVAKGEKEAGDVIITL